MSNNFVLLQGWLLLSPSGIKRERVDGQDIAYLRCVIDTDSPIVGGRHIVVLVGEAFDKARALLAAQGRRSVRVQAAVKGKLLTYRGKSVVQSEDVSLIPAELEIVG